MSSELAKIDSFRREIAIAETIEEVKMLTTKGEILAEMAKKLKIPLHGQQELGKTRIALEEKKRTLIEELFPKGGDRKSDNQKSNSETLSLIDAGITHNESSDAKIIKEEKELVQEVIQQLEEKEKLIEPKTVAAEVRKKKKEIIRQQAAEAINSISETPKNLNPEISEKTWYKVKNQFLYFGSNTDPEFINFLPPAKLAFADPPYNAGVDDWDSDFIWQQDYLQDIAEVVAVTPGGWNAFNFYKETEMKYHWEMFCWINNGMTHGRCGFANVIKTSIFGNTKPKIPMDFWQISIKTSQTADTKHKGRKPYEFMSHLIMLFTKEGDCIIDPFAGSGTTLLLSEQLNRVSYNAEISREFCIDIIKRVGSYGQAI